MLGLRAASKFPDDPARDPNGGITTQPAKVSRPVHGPTFGRDPPECRDVYMVCMYSESSNFIT